MRSSSLAFLALVLFSPIASGQYMARPTIGGLQVYCTLRDGTPVLTSYSSAINDVAISRNLNGTPLIVIKPSALAMYPDAGQRFLYAHECMHHRLDHTNQPLNLEREVQADCEGMKLLNRQHLLTREGALVAASYFRNNPPLPPFYPPGPERAARMIQCFDGATVSPTNAKTTERPTESPDPPKIRVIPKLVTREPVAENTGADWSKIVTTQQARAAALKVAGEVSLDRGWHDEAYYHVDSANADSFVASEKGLLIQGRKVGSPRVTKVDSSSDPGELTWTAKFEQDVRLLVERSADGLTLRWGERYQNRTPVFDACLKHTEVRSYTAKLTGTIENGEVTILAIRVNGPININPIWFEDGHGGTCRTSTGRYGDQELKDNAMMLFWNR